jgi:hypothetical protein
MRVPLDRLYDGISPCMPACRPASPCPAVVSSEAERASRWARSIFSSSSAVETDPRKVEPLMQVGRQWVYGCLSLRCECTHALLPCLALWQEPDALPPCRCCHSPATSRRSRASCSCLLRTGWSSRCTSAGPASTAWAAPSWQCAWSMAASWRGQVGGHGAAAVPGCQLHGFLLLPAAAANEPHDQNLMSCALCRHGGCCCCRRWADA